MSSAGITAHMIVKNEDRWIWYALQAILPYVDRVLVTDTGSTDQTLDVIAAINSPKIELQQVKAESAAAVTSAREQQLKDTETDWIWIVDADEVYPQGVAEECVAATRTGKYEGIVVRRFDLLGDIYHRQRESVGTYRLFRKEGHLLVRLVNRHHIKGLHYRGDYPLEGFYDQAGHPVTARDPSKWYITQGSLYHAMYLKRSSQGKNLASMFNRSKYKVETGLAVTTAPPEVLRKPRPELVPDVTLPRSLSYKLAASLATPVKELKRRLI